MPQPFHPEGVQHRLLGAAGMTVHQDAAVAFVHFQRWGGIGMGRAVRHPSSRTLTGTPRTITAQRHENRLGVRVRQDIGTLPCNLLGRRSLCHLPLPPTAGHRPGLTVAGSSFS